MNAIKKLDIATLALNSAKALEASLKWEIADAVDAASEARDAFKTAQRSPTLHILAKAQLALDWKEAALDAAIRRRDAAIGARVRAETSVEYWEVLAVGERAQVAKDEARAEAKAAAKARAKELWAEAQAARTKRREARRSKIWTSYPPLLEVVEWLLPHLTTKPVMDGVVEVRNLRAEVVAAASTNTKEGLEARQVNSCISRVVDLVRVYRVVKPLLTSMDTAEAGAAKAVVAAVAASYAALVKYDQKAYNLVLNGLGEAAGHPCLEIAAEAIVVLGKLKAAVNDRGWSTVSQGFQAKVVYGTVLLSVGDIGTSMTTTTFCDLMKIAERVVVVDVKRECQRHLHLLERVVMARRAGIHLKGMVENTKVWSVIDCPVGGNTRAGNFTAASVVKAPMANPWLASVLHAADLFAHIDSDAYGTHGYVSKYSEVFRTSAFIDAVVTKDGQVHVETYEPISKVAIRTAKQDKPEEVGFRTTSDFVVVSAPTSLLEAVKAGTATAEECETVNALIASFLGGCGASAGVFRKNFGTHRQVGAGIGGLGQKVVVGDGMKVLAPMFRHLLLEASPRPTVVIGLSSVKSATAKAALVWEPIELENGVNILCASVQNVDVCITESAATNAWEKVPASAEGDAGHLAATVKRVSGVKAPTLMMAAYAKVMETGLSLAEVLLEMQASGEIRRKNLSAKFNTQMLQSTRTYLGAEQVDALLKGAMAGPKGSKAVRDINMVMDLVHGRIDPNNIHDVTLDVLVGRMVSAVYEAGQSFDKEWSINQHGSVVVAVLGTLVKRGKDWVRIVGTHDTAGVLFPAGKSLATSYESTGVASFREVNGLLAELMEALWHYVSRSVGLDADEAVEKGISSAEEGLSFKMIREARDQVAGKALARVQTYGSSLLLCTSADLAPNEVDSHVIRTHMGFAEKAYNEAMGVVLAKSPTILAHQVRRVVVRELDVVLGRTEERAKMEALLDGTCGYVAADATVLNGDDADGDSFAAYILPASCMLKGALGETTYVDPSNPTLNCMASHAVEHYINEETGLFVGSPRTLVKNVFTCAEIEAQVLEAAAQKAKVAEYTASQMSVQLQEVLVEADIVAFLQDGKNYPAMWDSATFDVVQQMDLNALARNIRLTGECVLGNAVQLDAMNNIKGEDGEKLLEMAQVLSPRRLRTLAKRYTPADDICQDITLLKEFQQRDLEKKFSKRGAVATPEQVAKYLNDQAHASLMKGMTQVASLFALYNVDFSYRGMNLDMIHLDDEVQVRLLVAGALVWAYARVGNRNEGAMCLESVIMKDVGVFANRRSVADLENLVRVTEASGVSVVSYDCVEAQLVAMAEHYRAL